MSDPTRPGVHNGIPQDSDGRPQPASQPMDQQTAEQLCQRTGGQLRPMPGDEPDQWYVYQPDAQS